MCQWVVKHYLAPNEVQSTDIIQYLCLASPGRWSSYLLMVIDVWTLQMVEKTDSLWKRSVSLKTNVWFIIIIILATTKEFELQWECGKVTSLDILEVQEIIYGFLFQKEVLLPNVMEITLQNPAKISLWNFNFVGIRDFHEWANMSIWWLHVGGKTPCHSCYDCS